MQSPEDLAMLRDSIRKLVERNIAPIANEIAETDRFPQELIEIYGDMGLLQMWVPEKYDGPGGDLTSVCIAREEIARVSEACSLLAANNSIGLILPLLHFGNEEQRQRFLPLSAKGRTITSVAITEPEAGSDVGSMKTRAVRDGNAGYVVNGQKCYITFGNVADYILLFAKTDPEARGFNGISAFIVDAKNSKGLHIGKNERKMGIQGIPNVELFFEDMFVPAENRVGEEGNGFLAAMKILDLNRPTIGAVSVGLAQGALDCALDYAKGRVQFRRPITDFQGIQWMLADMAMQIEAARALVYKVARQVDEGNFTDLPMLSAMAKCYASDMAMKVTTDAVQIYGGAGYMKDHPVERMMRDAKINQIFEGTNQIQRSVIARELIAHA